MENKLSIAIVALMVAALAAPAVMAAEDVEYSVSISTAANVAVAVTDVDFDTVLAGTTTEISPSLTLTNSGNSEASVSAKFTTNDGGSPTATYGLTTISNDVIGGSNFKIGTNGNELALNDGGTDTALTGSNVAADGGTASYDAILTVPTGQAGGDYTGTVQLTFTSV